MLSDLICFFMVGCMLDVLIIVFSCFVVVIVCRFVMFVLRISMCVVFMVFVVVISIGMKCGYSDVVISMVL